MEMLGVVLSSLLRSAPSFIVEIVLIVIAVSRWNRHPRVSMLASFSGGFMLVLTLITNSFFALLPVKLLESGKTASEISVIYAVVGGISGVLHAIALGLLVAAVFAERPTTSPPQGFASFSGR